MVYAVVRIRGSINTKPDIKHTLRLLRLTRVNHCVLVEENNYYKGMLQVVKDYTTWGEINKETLSKLIRTRGRLIGDKELTEEYIKASTPYDSFNALSQAIIENKFKYREIPDVKPLFRLNPPRKGYKSTKKSFREGGSLGYRGEEINKLLERMI